MKEATTNPILKDLYIYRFLTTVMDRAFDINDLSKSPIPHSFDGRYHYSASGVTDRTKSEDIEEGKLEGPYVPALQSESVETNSPAPPKTLANRIAEILWKEYADIRKVNNENDRLYRVPLVSEKDRRHFHSDHHKNVLKKLIDVYLLDWGITNGERDQTKYYEWIKGKKLKDSASIRKVNEAWIEREEFRNELSQFILQLEPEKILRKKTQRDYKEDYCYFSILEGLKLMIQYFRENKIPLGSVQIRRLWPSVDFDKISP